jgi:O-acetyl-ADP-ribose deacetylase (regulator of RNase III)
MIEEAKGNLLEADVEAVVNTVNCVGHMGKGIALQFKQAFPANYAAYRRACEGKDVQPGRMFVFETGALVNPRIIINFPTKRDWRGKSQMADIEAGLVALVEEVRRRNLRSIAVPPLGCGLGGLAWSEVKPRILRAFEALPEVRVLLYAPAGAPAAAARPVRTARPKMTTARALFIKLMEQYLGLDYDLTLLEIQKLAYFLQEAGEPLRLKHQEGIYGPYADNLNKVLEQIEGHFTRGYSGERNPGVKIELLPGAIEEATGFLKDRGESLERLERVGDLIAGFETPYGMELLASVHWVVWHRDPAARDVEDAIGQIHAWNPRKRNLMKTDHIGVAWQQLHELGWLN